MVSGLASVGAGAGQEAFHTLVTHFTGWSGPGYDDNGPFAPGRARLGAIANGVRGWRA